MDNEIRGFPTADDDIHMQMHYAVESVRQCWVALTQGDNEPCEGDYDALFGVYLRLSQLDKEFCGRMERLCDCICKESRDNDPYQAAAEKTP